mgnify:CR=1 FL=1
MGYRLENKEIELEGLRKLSFTPTQKAGDVYRYKNYALRIFKEGEEPIDQQTAKYLTDISTDRIILPRKLLFYNNAFKGYTMKLVSQKGSGKRISTTPKEDVLESIVALEKDIETLSQKKVLLNGATPGYTLYNGSLYIVDPSNYRILDAVDTSSLEQLNQFQLHLLITELIAADLRKARVQQSTIQHLKEILNLRDNEQTSSDYLRELLQGQSNIKGLVKKIR